MPESIELPRYPYVKPVDAKGYIARLHSMYDMVVTVVPEGIVAFEEEVQPCNATITESSTSTAEDLGIVDVTAPSPEIIATDVASAEVRVS